MNISKLCLISIFIMLSLSVNADDNATQLTPAETQKLLVGHTYPFTKGGMYFYSATDAIILWDGKTEKTKWHTTKTGRFCYKVELFGGFQECIGLFKKADGNYIQVYDENKKLIRAVDIKKGKTF